MTTSEESATTTQPEDGSNSVLGSIRSVAEGAAFDIVVKILATGLGFLFTLLLTRGLGASLYGIFAYGQQILSTVKMFTNLGTDVSSVKYLSAKYDDPQYQRRVLWMSYSTTLLVSVIVGAAVFVLAPPINAYTLSEPLFETALRIFAIVIPFQAMTQIAISSFRGLELPQYQALIKVVRPATQLLVVAAAIAVGFSLLGVVAAFAIAGVFLFVFSYSLLISRTDLSPERGVSTAEQIEFYNFSLPFMFSRAGALLYNRVDIFMIGFFLASTDVGVYNVALLMGGIIAMPLAAINQLFPSVVSRLYSDGDREILEHVYRIVTRWSITLSLLVALPIVLYREPLLAIFGSEFVVGSSVVVIFAMGQLLNAVAGPSNDVLTMTDHQYLVMINHWVFGVLNVVLNYYFILEFGVVGAALATASVLGMLNLTRVVQVWYYERLVAYSRQLWKPIAACMGAGVVMYGVTFLVSGIPLLALGGVVGLVAYGGLLYLFGIDDRDKEFAREHVL